MKQKLLLFLMMVSFGPLFAQTDTIRTLVFSEVRIDWAGMTFIELTNMGAEAVNLSEFEVLRMSAFTTFPDGRVWPTEPPRTDGRWLMLPDHLLGPGESFVLGNMYDFAEDLYAEDIAKFGFSNRGPHVTKPEMYKLSDLEVHEIEDRRVPRDPRDSASIDVDGQTYNGLLNCWSRDAMMLRHHPPGADSCVVDQVGGLFTDEDGTNPDGGHFDVAGMPEASAYATLVRRFDVKQGNLTWVTGTDLSDSEWIPVPHVNQWGLGHESDRAVFWTVGNHGDYNLDETTLISSTIDINWADQILTVPWGIRNGDSIMYQFDRVPGMAWHYHYSPVLEDSSFVSVRTGDSLTIYVCGNDLDLIKFHIEAAPPAADVNVVIPKVRRFIPDVGKYFSGEAHSYYRNGPLYIVTDGLAMDTISRIEFATRVDTLYKYLEKASNASWEIVEVDGTERTDLLNGDILKVTAEDGSVKEYFLQLRPYRRSHNASLSSITWPDIPEDYRDIFGWTGDTIPEFGYSKLNYKITVPWDVDGIPALVAKNDHDNARHVMDRATRLGSTIEDRTATITSTAEDDTSVYVYTVILEKEKAVENVQLWAGEPFISQYTLNQNWNNCLMEIVNPGNMVLDLSNYMVYTGEANDPASAITGGEDWNERYMKYIPGYKWQGEAEWAVQRHIAIQDVNINPIIWGGDVFVMADIFASRTDPYTYAAQIDIDFHQDPFGEGYDEPDPIGGWDSWNTYWWKILNDSIKAGTKPATDPNDFELIETFGFCDGTAVNPTGLVNNYLISFTRKPEFYKGNILPGGSFDTTELSSEWTYINENRLIEQGYGWPARRCEVAQGTGSHFMDDVTIYRSTISSLVYLPSQGFSMKEEIRGVVTGTTVDDFFINIIKADVDQALKVIAVADGNIIEGTASVTNGDTLVVISADSTNVSKYILELTDDGLSDDALLTSTEYTIGVDGATGTVEGMEYGTTLRTVVDNVVVPAGASLIAVDADDGYVPFKRLNFDTMYVDVTVTDQIYFEVIAEDMNTMIKYQLMPNATETDAFVTSDVFMVDQTSLLIGLIPQGTSVRAFMANLVPAPGATLKLSDKLGFERATGTVVLDDKLVVTAADGVTTRIYYLTLLNTVANYLAYVISDVYVVDQNALTIDGVLGTHSVADFNGNVTPSAGATMEAQNSDGTAKGDSDMMVDDDMLQVTAGNGVNVVSYVIKLDHTGMGDLTDANIHIYPNPSTGQLNIAGAEIGNRIRVYNAVGVAVRDLVVYSGIEMISLDDQPGGMFFITISDKDEIVGRYKVIKQ